jgi:kynurenine formamidase
VTSKKTYVDLTMAIGEDMPTNRPDHFAPSLVPYALLEDRGWRGSRITLDSHCGTHLDAPAHFVADGATVDTIAFDCLVGTCQVIDLPASAQDTAIGADDLPVIRYPRVLLRTKWSDQATTDPKAYFRHHPFLTRAAAESLVAAGVRLVGIDSPSVDLESEDAHLILLSHGVVIVENLVNLSALPEVCEIVVLPLPIVGGDGSPVRAIAILQSEIS